MRIMMKSGMQNREIGVFQLLYTVVSCVFILGILPSLGIRVTSGVLHYRVFECMIAIAFAYLICNKKLLLNRLSTTMLTFCLYTMMVTLINYRYQEQPFFYYATSVFYPWGIMYLTECSLSHTNEEANSKLIGFVSSSVVFYFVLNIYYRVFIRNNLFSSSGETLVYFALTLFPFVLANKKAPRRTWGMVLIGAGVLLSGKRTALVAYCLAVLAYYYVKFRDDKEKRAKVIRNAILAVICFILIYQVIVVYTGNDLVAKLLNTTQDGGSGRDRVYETVLEKFNESSWTDKLFGVGFNGVRYCYNIQISESIVSAHNDFLEALVDYGVFGLVLYLFCVCKFIHQFRTLHWIKSEYAAAMGACIAILLVISMFSHLFIYLSYYMNILIFTVFMEKQILIEKGRLLHVKCRYSCI